MHRLTMEKVMELEILPSEKANDTSTENPTEKNQTISQLSIPLHSYSRTQFESTKINYTWEIDRFISVYKIINVLISPPFPTVQYRIKMVIHRASDNICDKISFYLLTKTAFAGLCIISIMLKTGTILSTNSSRGIMGNKKLLGEIEDTKLHRHDPLQPLVISCEFEVFDKIFSNTIHMNELSLPAPEDMKDEKSTTDDKYRLIKYRFNSNKTYKFKIQEKCYFIPTKTLIYINSKPFNMLYSFNKPGKENMAIKFKDSETEAFKEMLLFIITGSMPKKINCTYEDLLTVAAIYDIRHLKLACEQHLLKQINIDNALSLIQLAITRQAKCLERHVIHFIKFHLEKIVRTKEYQMLPQEFLDEILKLIEEIQMIEKSKAFSFAILN